MKTRKLIYRLLNLAGLLGAVAWLTSQGGWEPAVTTIGLLTTFVYQDASRDGGTKHDAQLFRKFLQELPSSGASVALLKDHDLGGSFRSEELHDIQKFAYGWNSVEHEFDDAYVNAYLTSLKDKNRKFLTLLATNTIQDSHGVVRFIPDDWDMKAERRRVKEELNALATETYAAHQELIKQARKHL